MSKEPESNKMPPKSESAAAHNPFSAFDPMAAWTSAQATWHKMLTDGFSRAQSWADEYASIEAQMYGRALQAVDTWAQLCRDTIHYSQQLSMQARKLGFDAVRRAGISY